MQEEEILVAQLRFHLKKVLHENVLAKYPLYVD